MLQQTTVKAVIPYFEKFTRRWPNIEALASTADEEIMAAWAGLGYYSRARKLIECASAIVARGGFPQSAEELIELPGIGPYTSAAIAAIAFNKPSTVIDGNVERVISRLYAIEMPLPHSQKQIRAHAEGLTPQKRAGDYAQAIMDLGAMICTPRNPACPLCPWNKNCQAYALGQQERYPVKQAKKERIPRRSAAYWITHGNHVLLRKRPSKGLLGGMMEVPSEGWRANYMPSISDAPAQLDYVRLEGQVAHTFTHFDVEVTVYSGNATEMFNSVENACWHPVAKLQEAGLPSVMVKVAKHALDQTREQSADL